VGDRGHRKGQLRVVGSPSVLHTKEPRAGGDTTTYGINAHNTQHNKRDAGGGVSPAWWGDGAGDTGLAASG
jgi:hypothetical protein